MGQKKAEHQKAVEMKNHRTKAEAREQAEGVHEHPKEVEKRQEAHQ